MTPLEHDAAFHSALDDCCHRLRRGEQLEACLADYPEHYRVELARLVPVAQVSWPIDDPSPAFRERLERTLLAAVDVERRAAGNRSFFHRYLSLAPILRTAAIALVVLLVLAGGSGVIQASDSSLPDSPLYQVKKAREYTELVLARSSEDQLTVHVRQIEERGRELDRAVQSRKQSAVIDNVALRLARSIERAVDRALELREQGNPQPATRALAIIRTTQRRIDRFAVQTGTEERPIWRRLNSFLEQQAQRLTGSRSQRR